MSEWIVYSAIDELIHLIGNLNNNKGAGPDNIGPRLLNEMSSAIIQPFLARDVIYTSRAYATMSVSICLSVCLWRKCIGTLYIKFRSHFTVLGLLLYIINLSLSTGIVPDKLKLAKIPSNLFNFWSKLPIWQVHFSLSIYHQ